MLNMLFCMFVYLFWPQLLGTCFINKLYTEFSLYLFGLYQYRPPLIAPYQKY